MTGHPGQIEDGDLVPTIPEQVMRARLADATAEPLLPDTFPVPVRYDGRWWHQPAGGETEPADGLTGAERAVAFVPASAEQAGSYDDLHRRRRQAHAAPGDPPDE